MKQFFTNTESHIVFVGGKMIAPGATRLVEMPAISGSVASKPDAAINFAELLAVNIGQIPDAIAGLNVLQLNEAMAFEEANANRKGAKEAISEAIEMLDRQADLSDFALSLSSVDDIQELLLSVADDEAKTAMVEQEIADRKANQQ